MRVEGLIETTKLWGKVWSLAAGTQALKLSDRLEGGGEGRGVRMDRKATTPAKNDEIAEKLLRFVNFPEDKVGMMVRKFLKMTKFPKDMLEEMVEQDMASWSLRETSSLAGTGTT